MTKECECAAHSAAECCCGSWDEPDYKALYEQMCNRCAELDLRLAEQEQEPFGFLTNHRQRFNFEPNMTGMLSMPMTVDWKIPLYGSPQHQLKPLNRKQINKLIKIAGYGENPRPISDFINGITFAEVAHGIER